MSKWYPRAHQRLAIAMVIDALNDYNSRSEQRRREAEEWLFRDDYGIISLDQACQWAGVSKYTVRRKALEMRRHNLPNIKTWSLPKV